MNGAGSPAAVRPDVDDDELWDELLEPIEVAEPWLTLGREAYAAFERLMAARAIALPPTSPEPAPSPTPPKPWSVRLAPLPANEAAYARALDPRLRTPPRPRPGPGPAGAGRPSTPEKLRPRSDEPVEPLQARGAEGDRASGRGADASGGRRRRTRVCRPPRAMEGGPPPLPWATRHSQSMAALGLDLVALALDSGVIDRARAIRWVSGLTRRPRVVHRPGCTVAKLRAGRRGNGTCDCPTGAPIDRGRVIAACGRLVVGRELYPDGTWVPALVHAMCGDRACPICARIRGRQLAAALRLFVAPRIDRVFFWTATQLKRPIEVERAGGAADRILESYRATVNQQTAGGRLVRLFWSGGCRSLEVVLASAGTVRRDGSRVEFSGWHAHLHALLEASDATLDACWGAIVAMGRCLARLEGDERESAMAEGDVLRAMIASAHKILARLWAAEPGASLANEWRQLGQRVLRWRWSSVSPGADDSAQDIQRADATKVGQLAKYVTKPFEIRNDGLARELFVALEDRKCFRAFGTWRGWAKVAATLDERAGSGDGAAESEEDDDDRGRSGEDDGHGDRPVLEVSRHLGRRGPRRRRRTGDVRRKRCTRGAP